MRRFPSARPRRIRVLAPVTAGLLTAGSIVLLAAPAYAATTFTVSTTADVSTGTGACGNAGITTAPSPLSLREATCLANNVGGAVTINVPAGTYNLTNGQLGFGNHSGANVTITGAGAASTIINAGGLSRVIYLDNQPGGGGGVDTTISGVTITGGADSTAGGGGIVGGSINSSISDSLTLTNVIVTGNAVNAATPTIINQPGGGVQFVGGQLTITNSTISNNTSRSSYGSGVAYYATGQTGSSESLTISNTTFSGNSTATTTGNSSTPDGGALAVFGTATTTYSVSNSRFVNNTATSTPGSGASVGAAIWQKLGTLTVTGTNFTGNSASSTSATSTGGAIRVDSGTANLHYNRFVGNVATSGSAISSAGTVDASDNWWGCNAGPSSAGCDTVAGSPTVSPRLVLTASASPTTVTGPDATSTITAGLTTDNLGSAVSGANLGAFAALPVTFSDPPGDATVTLAAGSHTAGFSAGQASIDYHSGATTSGPDPINVTFDNATVTTTVTVNQAPTITSANTSHFNVGQAGAFTVTTTGYPTPAITKTGSLPTGLSFTDNGDGTATLAGTATGPGGTFPFTVTADNGVAPNATQTLTVTVGQPPAFTSPSSVTYRVGTASSFTVTTSGIPTVSTITEAGTLPDGLSFTDNGNGTATLDGTPSAGAGGTYPVSLGATNGVTPNASQTLSIQVNQAPAVTTNPSDQTVNPGTSVSFIAAASGVPTPTVQWQHSTNGGASYTNVAGATSTTYTFTTAAGDNGNMYRAVFTNTVSTATTTAATLNVGTAPAFTSSNASTFAVGTAGDFAVTTSGVPSATLGRTGAQFPAWLTLTDNGDGTGSLTGTPPAGGGGTYTFTLQAANGFSPSASQVFTLFVDDSPVITSANHGTYVVGSAGSFAVTTVAGFPTTTALTKTGTLPAGLTFVDNGDGTATLAGTAAAGTAGTYPLTIQAAATGGITSPASQSFVLTVNGPPTITSANHATFAVGAAGSFTVTTSAGYPAATTITKTGTLPTGVTLIENGDGTSTLAGTPSFGTGGVYSVTITASNGVAPDATQSFNLTVNAPPIITSTNHATFTVGTAAAFTVTTAPGQPTSTTITSTGSLPAGVSFTDNGDGTATLAGTPTAGGTYPLVITASNGVLPNPTQAFALTVNSPPTITSADHATFALGAAGSFTVTTSPGVPGASTITATGQLSTGLTFTDNGDGTATMAGTPSSGTGGVYPLTITVSNGVNPNATQSFTLTVNAPPVITSANHATFTFGAANSFTVTTAPGQPTSTTITSTGTLPAGVSFTDNGDGTATLAGTPTAGGVYPLTMTAGNGVAPDASQSFTVTVNSTPTISSADHTTFNVGAAGTFTVTTTAGTPTATTISETGTLPNGVTLHDNGDGTATLAGTPTVGTGGVYNVTITASNGVLPDATQAFTLTVDDLPAITSANQTTFSVGAAGTFAVTTTAGFPTATSLTKTGALPSGVTFVDNGDGTATLAGTPASGSGGNYPITLTATNTAGFIVQNLTLTVDEPTRITSANGVTFTAGTGGTFTVTTSDGFPTPPTLTETGALPDGLTFTDNGDGTAVLAGTATAGGVYALTITANNGVNPDATQAFTLTVNGPPTITSAATTTFTVGLPGTFTVTTLAGVPATPLTLTETGALPTGVTFLDNGDGTATLAATAGLPVIGSYSLTIVASNGVNPKATQGFTLHIASASIVSLPPGPPTADGTLEGVPSTVLPGAVLHISGTGFAAGAPITIGVYSSPVVLSQVAGDAAGAFTASVLAPSTLGAHTLIAAGMGASGVPIYLEAAFTVVAPLASGASTLPDTGLDTNPRVTVTYGLVVLLVGMLLLAAARRREWDRH